MMQVRSSIHKNFFTFFLVLQSLLFLSSCKVDQAALEKAAGEAGFTLTNNTLSIIGGNNQSVAQNAGAPTALAVIVRDQNGLAKSGIDVEFEIMTTNGGQLDSSVTQKSVTTGSNGRSSVTYTAGTSLGEVVISATIPGSSVTFTQTVTDASLISSSSSGSTLLMLRGNNAVIEQNSTVQLEVLALNSAGVAMANTDVTFEVLTTGSISNPLPATGTPTGSGIAAKTGSNGRASVNFTAPSTLGTATIVARSTAGSVAFNLSVGVAGVGSTLSISNGNGQVIVPNSLASEDLEVIATSASGSPLSGITVTFTVTTTNGGVLSNSQGILVTTTDANGKASTNFTSSNTSGPISVLASSSVGSVTFALNTSTNGSGGGGGNISFNPTTFSPASGSWLNTNVGAAPSKSVTVTNTASFDLYINSIFTTTSTPFNIISDTCPRSPAPLASTASCTVVISFSPTGSETFSKFLFLNWSSLNDGSNGQNAVLPLEGSGPPALTFAGITSVDNITTTGMRLNWLAATGGTVSQYRVYQISSGVPTLLATLPHTTLNYTLSGLVQNTTYTYRVRAVNTANEEDGNNNDVSTATDMSPVPVLSEMPSRVFPSTPVYFGDTVIKDFNKTNATPETDTGMTYACKFSRVVNGEYDTKSPCSASALGGTFQFNPSNGVFSWTPKFGTQGVFEFAIRGSDTNGPGYRYFTVDVAHAYASPNLSTILADFRSSFGNLTGPNSSTASNWSNLISPNDSGSVSSGTAVWGGSEANSIIDPQRVTFNGSTLMNLGNAISGNTSYMIDYWISNPESTFGNGRIVMKMDNDSTDNGFKITQNTLENGQRALRIDFERSYERKILSDGPVAYWRMDATTGTTVQDVLGTNNLTLADTSNSPANSNVVFGLAGATRGELSSTALSVHTHRILLPNVADIKPSPNFSVEMWVKYPSRVQPADHDLYNFSTASVGSGFSISILSGVLTVKYKPTSASTVTLTQNPNSLTFGNLFDTNWHHIVFTSSSNNKIIYLDGMILASDTTNNGAVSWPATPDNSWVTSGADASNPVQIDEVAVYNTALTANQVLNHLSTGDHFVPKQTYYPANTQLQSRPMGFWRFGEAWDTQQVTQDYSGNQADAINWNSWNHYTAQGPYVRTGGSGLDLTGATYFAEYYTDENQVPRVSNSRHLSFDQKFTISEWINFYYTGEDRHFSILNTRNLVTGTNNYGISIWANNQGKIVFGFGCTYSNFCPNYVATASAVVPTYTNWAGAGSLNTNLRSGWTHIAVTFDGTQPANNRVQVYVHGIPVKMATAVGTIPSTLSALTGPINSYTAYDWQLNGIAGGSGRQLNNKPYAFADYAIYGSALNASEIRAQAYEGSLRYCDVPVTSNLQDPSNSKPFDYINMLYNVVQSSGQLQVYRNSKLECALRPGVSFGSESLPLLLGSSSNGFRGHLTDLRIHASTSNTVASITNTHKAFMGSADQHRIVPVGNIITDNLVRAYEPSTAMDGMRPYSSGNEDAKIFWQENGNIASGTRQEPGYLRGFAGYAGKWNGTGIPTDPYRLSFDGNGWVDLGTTPTFELSTKNFTACLWEKTTSTSNFTLFHRGNTSTNFGNFAFGTWSNQIVIGVNANYWYYNATHYNTLKNGLWHYVCLVTDGTNATFYLDGTSLGGNSFTGHINANATKGGDRVVLGHYITRRYEGNNYGGIFVGDMGGVHIYNSALTGAQIKQNCSAQAANYNMTTCAP